MTTASTWRQTWIDFYRKWIATGKPGVLDEPTTNPYVGEEIPRYTGLDRDYLYSKEYDALVRSQMPPPLTKTRLGHQPIKARKALKKAKKRK